jgi:hypothetical protein
MLRVALWLMAASFALVVVSGARRGWVSPAPLLLPTTLVAASLAAWFALAPHVEDGQAFVDLRTPSDGYVCRAHGEQRVCVWSGETDLLTVYADAMTLLTTAGEDTGATPATLAESGLERYLPDAWAVMVLARHPSSDDIVSEQLGQFVPSIPVGCERYEEEALGGAAWQDVLLTFLSQRSGVALPSYYAAAPPEIVRRVTDLSAEQRRSYFRAAAAATHTCTPVPPIP